MDTSDNTVLVTGGGSGIGLALARALCAENNTVVVVGRDAARLAVARTECPALHTLRADITDEQDRQRLAEQMGDRFGGLNVLVNNAAVACFNDLRTDPDAYVKVRLEAETNYLAPVRLVQLLLGQLESHSPAAIINITTIGAYLPMSVMPGYSASKAALHSFTRSLRLQLAGSGIRVFEVLAPPVDTALVAAFRMRKMAPDDLAAQVLRGLRRDRYEMRIGAAKALGWLARLAPGYAERAANRQLLRATKAREASR